MLTTCPRLNFSAPMRERYHKRYDHKSYQIKQGFPFSYLFDQRNPGVSLVSVMAIRQWPRMCYQGVSLNLFLV